MMDFDTAFEQLISHEGGLSTSASDPGNWTGGLVGSGKLLGTKFGIAANTYPGEDIEHLTIDRARELYRRDYWGAAGCDAVPDAAKFDLFDAAVNAGVKAAIKFVQSAVGEVQDGILGPRTLQAINSMPSSRFVARFNGARLRHMTDLPVWGTFSRGWARRIADNLSRA